MGKHFFNTSNLHGKQLKKADKSASSQETDLLVYLKLYKGMTASQAHSHFPKSVPLTSIRRAMIRLMIAGKVEKTERQIIGPYGQPEYVYQLSQPKQMKLLI